MAAATPQVWEVLGRRLDKETLAPTGLLLVFLEVVVVQAVRQVQQSRQLEEVLEVLARPQQLPGRLTPEEAAAARQTERTSQLVDQVVEVRVVQQQERHPVRLELRTLEEAVAAEQLTSRAEAADLVSSLSQQVRSFA